jgi:hypothetical protein
MIGSRRWGAVARVLRGTTGEALMQDAAGPIPVVAPRRLSPTANRPGSLAAVDGM